MEDVLPWPHDDDPLFQSERNAELGVAPAASGMGANTFRERDANMRSREVIEIHLGEGGSSPCALQLGVVERFAEEPATRDFGTRRSQLLGYPPQFCLATGSSCQVDPSAMHRSIMDGTPPGSKHDPHNGMDNTVGVRRNP
jgi:hypothetical protein